MKRAEVAIIASPSMGNLLPAVEFANHFINHHLGRISVAILVISMPNWQLTDDYIQSLTSNNHIRFIQMNPVDLPQPHQYNSFIEFSSLYIENHKPMVLQTLKNLTTAVSDPVPVPLVGLFVDMFCTSMIDVANIPCYLFFASPAAYLGFVLHLTTLPTTDWPTELTVPSYANPVPSIALPT